MFNKLQITTAARFLWAVALLFGFWVLTANAAAPLMYAVNNGNNHLISFSADNPSVLLTDVAITGLAAGINPQVVHIAYSNNIGGASSTTLYGIDYQTDRLVRVSAARAAVRRQTADN